MRQSVASFSSPTPASTQASFSGQRFTWGEPHLSLAALEGPCADTLYAATAGGMGPATVALLQQLLEMLANDPAGLLIAATDADTAGRRYAARLRAMATEAGVRFDAILPPDGLNDWDDALRAMTPVS